VRFSGESNGFAHELSTRGFECHTIDSDHLSVRFPEAEADADPLFQIAERSGTRITEIAPVRSTLEEIFLHELTREAAD
jgi:hypothetical protein